MVRGKPVVDSGREDDEVSGQGLDPDPLVVNVADVKVTRAGLNQPEMTFVSKLGTCMKIR